MIKYFFSILATCFIFFSCTKNKGYEISYHTLNGDLINDSIHTRMPGEIFILDDHIAWHDPFNSENFIHYIDKHTQKEVAAIGSIGQGPDEFSTPILSKTYDNNMLIFELSGKKQAFFITESIIKKKQDPYFFLEEIENEKINTHTGKCNIDNNTIITFSPGDKDSMFTLSYSNSPTSFKFGRFFLHDKTRDAYSIYQGFIGYNEQKNIFIYANRILSYISIYEYSKQNKTLSLLKEVIEDYKYNNINYKQLTIDNSKRGCMGLALSKDFIVMQKRDYNSDNTNENDVSFNSFDKLPKTVFLYDYDGNLRHIVNLGVPILRIAANTKDNSLYIIAVDPEYVIMKYNLNSLNKNQTNS